MGCHATAAEINIFLGPKNQSITFCMSTDGLLYIWLPSVKKTRNKVSACFYEITLKILSVTLLRMLV
jgi:hypothetical protein